MGMGVAMGIVEDDDGPGWDDGPGDGEDAFDERNLIVSLEDACDVDVDVDVDVGVDVGSGADVCGVDADDGGAGVNWDDVDGIDEGTDGSAVGAGVDDVEEGLGFILAVLSPPLDDRSFDIGGRGEDAMGGAGVSRIYGRPACGPRRFRIDEKCSQSW
jgi:hypothetical protein